MTSKPDIFSGVRVFTNASTNARETVSSDLITTVRLKFRPCSQNDRILHTTAMIITGALSITILALSIFYTMPSNVLSTRDGGAVRRFSVSVDPQNWAFFTRDPDSVETVARRVSDVNQHDQNDSSLMLTPQSRAKNYFGITRTQRAQGVEIGYLNSRVQKWNTCQNRIHECLIEARKQPSFIVRNTSPVFTVCGNVVLDHERVVPWAFRDIYPEPFRVQQTSHLYVVC